MSSDEFYEEQPFLRPPLKARKGRGAVSNLQGRHEALRREAVDDGWPQADARGSGTQDFGQRNEENAAWEIPEDSEGARSLKTEIIEERAKTILTRNQSPDVPFS